MNPRMSPLHVELTPEQVREIFKHRGLRCTRQRELIFSALAHQRSHPTAEDLYRMVRADEPGLSLATVYNTLDALSACGLIRRLPSTNPSCPSRYDADIHPHVHITLDDGRVLDVPDDLSAELLSALPSGVVERLEQRLGVRVSRVSLDLSGTLSAR